MKKTIALFICIFCFATSNAQEFQGKAIYKTHRKFDVKLDSTSNKNSKMNAQFLKMLKKSFQKTYTLSFNKTVSVYKQNQKLAAPQKKAGGIKISFGGSGRTDVLYKNIY